MNKRPHPGGLGLPAKPYIPPGNPGPAPPLPPGPPPAQSAPPPQAQPAYGAQEAAHAAAWAAYYASQGVSAGAAYTAAATPQPPAQTPAPASATTPNPYANYGYGAGASIAKTSYQNTYQAPAQPQQPVAGPSQPYNYSASGQAAYNPQQAQPAYGVQAGYNPQAAGVAYQPPQQYQAPAQATPGRPPYAAPQQGGQQAAGYGWNPSNGPTQPYRPPQPAQQYAAQPQQPFYPQQNRPPTPQPFQNQQQQQQPYRPPAPAPNRPYQPGPPQNRLPSGPGIQRPPIQHGPGGQGSNFPPAKRPRFDGPGGSGPMNGHGNASPIRPGARPPFGMNGAQGPSGPSNFGGVRPAFGRPPNPPPIHLGAGPPSLGGPTVLPPQRIGFGGPSRGGIPIRGGLPGRGGGGGGRGMAGAPRGPAGMRRPDPVPRRGEGAAGSKSREADKKKRDKERSTNGKDEKEQKTTMTDFRIVGIEFGELGWSWGLVGGNQDDEGKVEDGTTEVDGAEKEEAVPAPESEAETFKLESGENAEAAEASAETVEEKRGEKRKAKTNSPDGDDEDEVASKKRTPAFLSAHDSEVETKSANPDEPTSAPVDPTISSSKPAPAPVPTHESSQNRFRIYFESPPELDRIPKSQRKGGSNSNPNKRWRRETSSVAPSRAGDVLASEDGLGADHTVDGEEKEGEDLGDVVEEEVDTEASEPVVEVALSEAVQNGAEASIPTEEEIGGILASLEAELAKTDAPATSNDIAPPTDPAPTNLESTFESEQVQKEPLEATLTAELPDTTEAEVSAEETLAEDSIEQTLVGDEEESEAEHVGDVSMRTDSGVELQASAPADTETQQAHSEAAAEPPVDTTEPLPAIATDTTEIPATSTTDAPSDTEAPTQPLTGSEATAAELASALAASAQNTASAYSSRPAKTRRWSESSSASHEDEPSTSKLVSAKEGVPSTNRLSILYEDNSRRLCFDAEIVDRVRIHRAAGKIEVGLKVEVEVVGERGDAALEGKDVVDDEVKKEVEESVKTEEVAAEASPAVSLPRGILVETYDNTEQRFVSMTQPQLVDLYTGSSNQTVPPLHRVAPMKTKTEPITFTVYLNLKKPLSEPKWCRTNLADEWLVEQFGKLSASDAGWKGKLEIVDPDPPPTLQSILEGWTTSSSGGPMSDRKAFTQSLLADPNNLLEILLRLTRGERNPTTASVPSTSSTPTTSTFGALASAIRPDSPYASHQTHVSLAILAMYRLTTDFAAKAGEKQDVVDEKIGDIIKSLPVGMICRSLDGLYKEWVGGRGKA